MSSPGVPKHRAARDPYGSDRDGRRRRLDLRHCGRVRRRCRVRAARRTDERLLERARSDFVATASHELRTPLAAVYGSARTLRRADIELRARTAGAFPRDHRERDRAPHDDRLPAAAEPCLRLGPRGRGRAEVPAFLAEAEHLCAELERRLAGDRGHGDRYRAGLSAAGAGLLRAHLPSAAAVWVFGSRATGRARRYSDLDLAIDAGRRLTIDETATLREAFEESDLPYRVDIVDWNTVNEGFRSRMPPRPGRGA